MAESNALVIRPRVEEEEQINLEESPEQESMETLLEQEGLDIDFPKAGETRTGVIASIGETEILVSVGAKSEGVISGREFDQIGAEDQAGFKVGQEIPVFVLSPEDKNGNLVLSYNRAREEMDWEHAEKLLESQEAFDSKIAGYNKGGLIVPLGQLRGFVPASQVSLVRRTNASGDTPDQRWSKMVEEEISVQVIEVDRVRHRLILSERLAINETRESLKERLLDELKVGDIRTGRVSSLANFGAFVNIDGADGLVHLSEVSWERIQHPNEVLKVGQEVNVKVISIDQENKRIGLSIRQLLDDPWTKKIEDLREGILIEGTITHLTKFGAFARLGEEDLEGLIHISELSERRIEHPKEVVAEGDTMTLRIIKIDRERHRIGLSLRKVDSAAYADLDWKMLQNEIEAPSEEAESVEEEAEAVVEEVAGAEAEAVEEKAPPENEAEAEAEPVEEETPVEEEAEAVIEEVVDAEAEPVEEETPAEEEAEAVIEEVVEAEAEPVEEETPAEEEAEAVIEEVAEAEAEPVEEETPAEEESKAVVEETPEAETEAVEDETPAEEEAKAVVEETPEAETEAVEDETPPEEEESGGEEAPEDTGQEEA
jgi:small subunit ribosomal protein S1